MEIYPPGPQERPHGITKYSKKPSRIEHWYMAEEKLLRRETASPERPERVTAIFIQQRPWNALRPAILACKGCLAWVESPQKCPQTLLSFFVSVARRPLLRDRMDTMPSIDGTTSPYDNARLAVTKVPDVTQTSFPIYHRLDYGYCRQLLRF